MGEIECKQEREDDPEAAGRVLIEHLGSDVPWLGVVKISKSRSMQVDV